jgi:transcriptional regulator with XRE-family HTH domain
MAKRGRPKEAVSDKVDFEYLFKLCEAGLTDAQLAVAFGVDRRTITRYKADEAFLSHLKNGKHLADEAVERSLWERATGYSHPDVHISNFQGMVTVTDIEKHYPPDTVACIFWLSNRRKEKWRQKQDVNVEVNKDKLNEVMAAYAQAFVASPGQGVGTPDDSEVYSGEQEISDDSRGTQEL